MLRNLQACNASDGSCWYAIMLVAWQDFGPLVHMQSRNVVYLYTLTLRLHILCIETYIYMYCRHVYMYFRYTKNVALY